MIEDKDRYEFVTRQIANYAKRMIDMFKWFVQITSAIVGGVFYLKLSSGAGAFDQVIMVAPILIYLIAVFSCLQIAYDLWSQFGYRKAEAALLERAGILGSSENLRPRFMKMVLPEGTMIVGVLAIGIGTAFFIR